MLCKPAPVPRRTHQWAVQPRQRPNHGHPQRTDLRRSIGSRCCTNLHPIVQMLDRLFMLDVGHPCTAISMCATLTSVPRVHDDQCECSSCGNVNPEQIFDILEARTVDESTQDRRPANDTAGGATTPCPNRSPTTSSRRCGDAVHPSRFRLDAVDRSCHEMSSPSATSSTSGSTRGASPCHAAGGFEVRRRIHVQGQRKCAAIPLHLRHRCPLWDSVSARRRSRTVLLKREEFLQAKWHNFVHAKLAVVATVSGHSL